MTEKDLKRYSRGELIEKYQELEAENEKMRAEITGLREKLNLSNFALEDKTRALNDKQIMLDEAGNIALASLKISGIFELAQQTADQYLDNVKTLTERQEEVCRKREEECSILCTKREQECEELCSAKETETKAAADRLMEETEASCKEKIYETEKIINEMLCRAREESESYWADVSRKMEEFYSAHRGLRELLAFTGDGE